MKDPDALKSLLYAFSDAASFLFASPPGLALLAGCLVLALVLRVSAALSARRLAAKAAGERLGPGGVLLVGAREVGGLSIKALAFLPALAALAAGLVLVTGVAEASRRMDEYLANRQRIEELRATVRNLERRVRAVDVSVVEGGRGLIVADLSFPDPRNPSAPPRVQRVSLPGRELFVDAIVCNFAFSEITEGRALNLAIPFRAFSDEVAQSSGVELGLYDEAGVPLAYRRPADGIYGLDPAVFDARLGELLGLLRSDETARGAGIVRSLQGNAVHRSVRTGERFTVWIEQTGGLSIKGGGDF